MVTFMERFWGNVDEGGPDECWSWKRARYHDDYGMVGIRNQGRQTTARASALALMFSTATNPAGNYALHTCDNPPCCNPRHLYWGNQLQNIADMDQRGRANRPVLAGEANPRAKLTSEQVGEIRRLYATGDVSQGQLAQAYGVDQSNVSSIVRGKSWA